MEQLREAARILNESGVSWWVDCGVLLGLVREGRLLPGDNDIDIGCWAQAGGWDCLVARFEEAGYHVNRRIHRGMVYAYGLTAPGRLPVNLQVWRRAGDDAWSATRLVSAAPYGRGSMRWWLNAPFRVGLRVLWRRTSLMNKTEWTELLAQRHGLHVNCWRVPARFYNHLDRLDVLGFRLPIPVDAEALLEYRYGDWRTPRTDWKWHRDDGSYVWQRPPGGERTPPLGRD